MSEIRRRKIRTKKKNISKNKFLLTSKKCWLMEEKLIPLYQHLVESYVVKLREVRTVRVAQDEQQEDNIMEPQLLQSNSNTTNASKVILLYQGIDFCLTWLVH